MINVVGFHPSFTMFRRRMLLYPAGRARLETPRCLFSGSANVSLAVTTPVCTLVWVPRPRRSRALTYNVCASRDPGANLGSIFPVSREASWGPLSSVRSSARPFAYLGMSSLFDSPCPLAARLASALFPLAIVCPLRTSFAVFLFSAFCVFLFVGGDHIVTMDRLDDGSPTRIATVEMWARQWRVFRSWILGW